MDYKQIAKRHLLLMNQELYPTSDIGLGLGLGLENNTNNIDTPYNYQNEFDNTNNNNIQNTNQYTSNINLPYYFNFHKTLNLDLSKMTNIDIKYKNYSMNSKYIFILTYIGIIMTSICIDTKYLKSYGEFYKEWKEYYTKENSILDIYWYNEKYKTSTYDNPIFILLCLIDNKVSGEAIPIYWESMDDSYIKVIFKNKKVLYIDRKARVI